MISTNTSANISQDYGGSSLEPEPFRWVLRIIFVSIFLVGSILNFVVCSAIIRRKRMRTSNNIFTFNLAISDLLIVLIYIPTQMAAFENNHNWPLGNFACQIVYLVIPVCLSASIATLLAITSDRYRAIAYPMKPKLGASTIRWILLSIWLISLFVASPLVFVAGTKSPEPGMVYCDEMWPEGPYSVIYWISIFIIQYILPLAIILVLAILIAVKLRKNSLQMLEKTSKVVATAVRQRLKQSAKITNMLIALVVLYAICMLPQHIVYLLAVYGDLNQFKYRVYIIRFANVFPMANSALNPIAYGLNKEFKTVFRNFFKCQSGKDAVEDSNSDFSRSRRFRLAVYKHVDNEGNSVLEYGRKWKNKTNGVSSRANWNGQSRTRVVRTSTVNGNLNNNSCEVTESLAGLMDKNDTDCTSLKSDKPSPCLGDEKSLDDITIVDNRLNENNRSYEDIRPSKNNASFDENNEDKLNEEKRIDYKNSFDHCDDDLKQRLLQSQSSTESNGTQQEYTDPVTIQNHITNISRTSLEWDPTIDGNTTTKPRSFLQLNPSNCRNKDSLRPDNSGICFENKHYPENTIIETESPDVASSPSGQIAYARRFDRNMFVLMETVRETLV